MGLRRAERIAKALKVHPFDLLHPGPIRSSSPWRGKKLEAKVRQVAEDKADLETVRKRRRENVIPWDVVRKRLGL